MYVQSKRRKMALTVNRYAGRQRANGVHHGGDRRQRWRRRWRGRWRQTTDNHGNEWRQIQRQQPVSIGATERELIMQPASQPASRSQRTWVCSQPVTVAKRLALAQLHSSHASTTPSIGWTDVMQMVLRPALLSNAIIRCWVPSGAREITCRRISCSLPMRLSRRVSAYWWEQTLELL